VIVTADAIVIGGSTMVRVFDHTTRMLRHTIRPLVVTPPSCFGAVVAAFDAGLVVGDPCLPNGPIGVFDGATGAPLSVLRDQGFFDYLRGPHLAYGTTFLATLEFGNHQQLTAYRPCANGVLRPGGGVRRRQPRERRRLRRHLHRDPLRQRRRHRRRRV
jgi:hypothetical protein